MKTIISSAITAIYLVSAVPTNAQADIWGSTNQYVSSLWDKKEVENISFKYIYPKVFYKKSYFATAAISASIVTAGTLLFVTAGTGAPLAAAGVSTAASIIGGGGAGSYLAGLATVGSLFGEGMVLGGAILNGIVLGTGVGGTISLANMTIQKKAEASALMTAMSMDGIVYFKNPDSGHNEYRVRLEIPKDIGSKNIKQIVNNIYEANEEYVDALKKADSVKQKVLTESIHLYTESAIELFENQLNEDKKISQDDLIVLLVIAWRNGDFELFEKGISELPTTLKKDNEGFSYYLLALNSLRNNNIKQAIEYLDLSHENNNYALEPLILKMNLLGNQDFSTNEIEIDRLLKTAIKTFDSDKYNTFLNLSSLYYRVATIYFSNQKYAEARKFYQKSLDKLGFLKKKFFGKELKHTIKLSIANSFYNEGQIIKADKVYYEIINDIEENEKNEIEKIRQSYIGLNKK